MNRSVEVPTKVWLVTLLFSVMLLLSMGCENEAESVVPQAPAMTVSPASQVAAPTTALGPTDTPTQKATPAPSPTTGPTATSHPRPAPERTPAPTPAPTSQPTATPAPTPTSTPVLTPAERDRGALISFYTATVGQNWKDNSNWLTDVQISDWYGVTVEEGRVTKLNLRDNNLAGQIPDVLTSLDQLTYLDLQGNKLSGAIPAELGNLTNLARLDLDHNGLVGEIPAELGGLQNLATLDLDFNQLEGPIPPWLGSMTNLQWMSLGNNPMDGPIPPELGDLENLRVLGLANSHLDGEIPTELTNLTRLETLHLGANRLTGTIPPELANLSNITGLWLHRNQLSGSIPADLGRLSDLTHLSLSDNRLTGEIPTAFGRLTDMQLIQLGGNRLEGCVPVGLLTAHESDFESLSLPHCDPPAELSSMQLEELFDEIVKKTEQREAFSEIKESNVGFSVLDDMKKLRSEFIRSETETELYYALWKLSNARRDAHLRVGPVYGGIQIPEEAPCVSAPVHALPDYSDIRNPTFFVAGVASGLTNPKLGDTIVEVNGRSIAQYVEEFTPWIRHSTLPGLYWHMAHRLPRKVPNVPPGLYSERLNLTLERPTGERYNVALPYRDGCRSLRFVGSYPGFVQVTNRENFNVLIDRSRRIILLQWRRFDTDELIKDIPTLLEYAEREQILDYAMIIDVSLSSGGSGGAYAIQRLVDQPFRPTFGNVRLSDLGKARIQRYVNRDPVADAPDILGLNLSRSWLYDWARTDATAAIRRGDEYTPPVPFKLAHLPKDSDGILQPAPVHFSGPVAIINAGVWGGSHLDQFVAMLVDNDLAAFIGMPTGGFSNTWEGDEVLRFPFTGRPVVNFQWSIGHTIRPNGEVLEGNPAQPDIYMPLTRENFREYHRTLLNTAIGELDR